MTAATGPDPANMFLHAVSAAHELAHAPDEALIEYVEEQIPAECTAEVLALALRRIVNEEGRQ
jgi:hypothetical protein